MAAALLEYAGDGNDRVARNIFEVGLEQFISAPTFVLQYAEFLIGLADIHNARALFERALGETSAANAEPIWNRFLQVRVLLVPSWHLDNTLSQTLEEFFPVHYAVYHPL